VARQQLFRVPLQWVMVQRLRNPDLPHRCDTEF